MKTAAGILLVGAVLASAQPPAAPAAGSPRPEAVFTVTATLVQIDAVVTDSKGHHVTDLKPEDFQVFEDGKPQKLTNFSYVRVAAESKTEQPAPSPSAASALPPAPLAPIRPEDVRRTIVLMVDDLGLSFADMAFVRSSLRKFANQQMQPGDLVSVCRSGGGSGTLQQFTSDKRVLLSIVDGLRWNMRSSDSAWDSTAGSLSDAGTLLAVDYIVGVLREMPGRKSVVLFSEGFAPIVGDFDAERAMSRLVDRAYRSGVVIYTMQATGLVARKPDPNALLVQQSLAEVAYATGGQAFSNGNDLNWYLDRVLEDQGGYYLLGYHPSEETLQSKNGEFDFRKIRVKVAGAGLRVRSRSGFLGETDDRALPMYATTDERIEASMLSPFKSSGVDLRLTALYAETPGHGPVVRNLLLIKGTDLTWTRDARGGGDARIVLMAAATSTGDRPLTTLGRVFDVRVEPDKMSEVMRDGALYVLDVPVPKRGPYQVRVAVQDRATAKTGSASQFLQIPDLKKAGFALTSVVLRDGGRSADRSGSPGVAAAARRFERGSLAEFLCAIEKAAGNAADPDLETRVRVLRDGQEVYSAPAHLVHLEGGARGVAGALRLAGSLTPGDYNLQVTAAVRNGGKENAASQWTDFTVLP